VSPDDPKGPHDTEPPTIHERDTEPPPQIEGFGEVVFNSGDDLPTIPKGQALATFVHALQDVHESIWRLQQIGDAIARALDSTT